MTRDADIAPILHDLEASTAELVRLAVSVAIGAEQQVRDAMTRAVAVRLNPVWVEELVLQTYLFAGFPRALNAAREWRRASARPAPVDEEAVAPPDPERLRERGERTCAIVYGDMYGRLRANVRELHPALDAWMVMEGYGKVLSRPGLDLRRRELCIVAVCAATDQERQLHSHLHGALHAGAGSAEIGAALELGTASLPAKRRARFRQLWERVAGGSRGAE
ncbi:MAG: carboxymuconolactone decarboxylase family protein [Gemmatimonadaceae bacterium]